LRWRHPVASSLKLTNSRRGDFGISRRTFAWARLTEGGDGNDERGHGYQKPYAYRRFRHG
jgi:hypothetical protein